MREHLYRGQRCHDRKWVYGNLIEDTNGTHYIYPSDVIEPDGHHLQFDTDEAWWVIPKTISEYTGLLDKNGVKIFEGDIVETEIETIGDVQFSHGMFGIEWVDTKETRSMVGGWGQLHNLRRMDDGYNEKVEVIGNIHDNPELLEVQQ
jgi:uncharacterized phage protein (TIGR01671 family)